MKLDRRHSPVRMIFFPPQRWLDFLMIRPDLCSPFALALIAGLSSPAGAATVTAAELLNDYNVIVFGNAASQSEVDGKAFIGGNLTGGGFDGHGVSAGAGLPALTVGQTLWEASLLMGRG
jgi:hypothetical protein